MNLATTYMGMPLSNPMIVGSSPLTEDIDMARRLEDEGAAALVLPSLYEEEITGDQMDGFFSSETYSDSFPEASSYIPEAESAPGPDEYLEHLRRVKQAVGIPVIASFNGSTPGGWMTYAHLMEEAGADAVELHLYHAASDPDTSSTEVESQMLQIVWEVKGELGIPVAEAMGGLLEPIEIVLSPATQCFLGCGEPVLQGFQLRHIGKEIGQIHIVDADDPGLVA